MHTMHTIICIQTEFKPNVHNNKVAKFHSPVSVTTVAGDDDDDVESVSNTLLGLSLQCLIIDLFTTVGEPLPKRTAGLQGMVSWGIEPNHSVNSNILRPAVQ